MLTVFVLLISYVMLGILLDEHDVINHPAYWSLYGAGYGLFAAFVLSVYK